MAILNFNAQFASARYGTKNYGNRSEPVRSSVLLPSVSYRILQEFANFPARLRLRKFLLQTSH